MKKYKIPQEVQREDRIFGPITMRRLIILCVGGGITWLFYLKLQNSGAATWFPPVFFFGTLTLSFAFLEPFGMRFGKFLTRILEFMILPKKRIWDKRFSHDSYLQYYKNQHRKWNNQQESVIPLDEVLIKKQAQRQKVAELSPLFEGDLNKLDLSLYQKYGGKK